MTAFGVTPAGFVLKPVTEILLEIEQDELALIAPNLDTSPEEPLGQLNGIMAEKLAEVWEIAQVAYNATNRGDAEGDLLDNVGGLTGTLREGPTPSSVYCTCTFTAAGTYAIGSLVGFIATIPSLQASNQVQIVAPATVGGSPIGTGNPYIATLVLFNSIGPAATGPDFGNALNALGIGHFTGQVPVTGWSAVVDTTAPTVGTFEELDEPYRIRQVQELGALGACSPDAIAAKVQEALNNAPQPVTNAIVRVYENLTMGSNPLGIPPKSFMTVVYDGVSPITTQDDPIIAQTIWNNKPAGISTFGTTTANATDSQGNTQAISFTRPAQLQVYMIVNVSVAQNVSAVTVQTLVQQAIVFASLGQPFVMFGDTITPAAGAATTLLPGQDVIAMAFRAIALGQAGVLDVPSLQLDFVPAPANTQNLKVSPLQIAIIQAGNVMVNVSVFVP